MTKARHIFVLLCALVGISALTATPALAKEVHVLSSSFGGACTTTPCGPGQFSEPQGVAVNDETGDVYVVDKGDNRVEYFSASGAYQGEFNGSGLNLNEGVKKPLTGRVERPEWVAVDNDPSSESKGDVYVTDNGHKAIDKFSSTGEYLGQLAGTCPAAKETQAAGECKPSTAKVTPFAELYGVAVDPAGELWVDQAVPGINESPQIDNYSGALASEFLESREMSNTGFAGAYHPTPGFAVGPEDGLYVDTSQSGQSFIRFGSGGEVVSYENEWAHEHSATAAAVNLSNNELYIDNGATVGAFNAVEAYPVPLERFGAGNLSAGTGIAVNSSTGNALSNTVYVADAAADAVRIFPYVNIPTVTTEPASNVEVVGHETVSATFNGTVEPGGLPVTSCEFEYGTSASYDHTVPCEQTEAQIGTTGKTPVTAKIDGLLPDTTYHFRLLAANKNDESNPLEPGHDETLTTPGPSLTEAPATAVTGNAAALSGEVNPNGVLVGECKFEYATIGEYKATGLYEGSVPCEHPDAGEIGSGAAPVPVHADLNDLVGGTTYRVRLVAGTEVLATKEKAAVAGAGQELTTLTTPVIAAGEAKEVSASAWDLSATVNPEGLGLHSCVFEYGTSTAYEYSVPCEQTKKQIGHGTEPVPVGLALSELQPNTEYHWRLVVSNTNGSSLPSAGSDDHTFVHSIAGSELPDDRAYEMVTPPFKNGALFGALFFAQPPSVSESGSRVIAMTIQCFAPSESCTARRSTSGEPFAFTRTAGGWETTALAPPATQFSENTAWRVSANEDTALFSMPSGPAKEEEWYARFAGGSFAAIGPLTPPGVTGQEGIGGSAAIAATADLSHVVWEKEGGGVGVDKSLYEEVGTHNHERLLVGVSGGQGSGEPVATCVPAKAALGSDGDVDETTWNALSADGRTVYFTVCGHELYARVDGETSEAHTVRISPGAGDFRGASEDGSRAFFTEGEGLYESECFAGCETLGEQRRVIDVSASETGGEGGGGPRVQGVVAISSDGSHVYFVAKGVLTAQANSAGQSARSGRDNLYVYQRDARYPEGHITFIVALATSDEDLTWNGTASGFYCANVTPDGRFLVFESRGDLTSDAHGGGAQIYRYDAATEQLVRISIGEAGFDDDGNRSGSAPCTPEGCPDDAHIVQAYTGSHHLGPVRGDPTMSNDGSFVFFESPTGLTPQALNDVVIGHKIIEASNSGAAEEVTVYAQNVYEWHEGHVYLISDGHDTSDANVEPCATGSAVCLLGTDASGDNVFFTTADRLVPKDTDTQVDIYDARICEPEAGNPCIVEPQPPLPPCDGENCHGIPPERSPLLTGGSETLNGKGNIAAAVAAPPKKATKKTATCKRGYVRRKVKKKERCLKAKSKAKKSDRGRVGR